MLKAKKKITVKETPQKSSAVSLWVRVTTYYQTNSRVVLGVIGGVIAFLIFGYVYLEGKKADDLEASRLLRLVQPLYQQQQFKLAISGDPTQGIQGFEQIVAEYDGTPSGELAQLYLAFSYLYTDNVDKAIEAFDGASLSGALMESAAIAGKASAYEAKKNYLEAAELYEKAAKMFENDYATADRFFRAGRMYCLVGDKEKAVAAFEKVKNATTPRYAKDIERLVAQYELEM